MKSCLYIIIFLGFIKISFGQDLNELTFIDVVTKPGTTFIVVNIKNLNTGITKEILTGVDFLFLAMEYEYNITNYDKIKQLILEKSKTRTFEFKNEHALSNFDLDEYQLKFNDEIETIIIQDCLIDSLPKITNQRDSVSKQYKKYSIQRQRINKEIRDSISSIRQLDDEESTILHDLYDFAYEWNYDKHNYNLSPKGHKLMEIWNIKTKPYREIYEIYTNELERLETKFFLNYLRKYDNNFLHVAFKFGIVFSSSCINGMTHYSHLVKI